MVSTKDVFGFYQKVGVGVNAAGAVTSISSRPRRRHRTAFTKPTSSSVSSSCSSVGGGGGDSRVSRSVSSDSSSSDGNASLVGVVVDRKAIIMMDRRGQGGGVWRRSMSKLTTNVKRELSWRSRSFADYEQHHQHDDDDDEDDDYDAREDALPMTPTDQQHHPKHAGKSSAAAQLVTEHRPAAGSVRNAISLDDRDDAPHYMLERVRLSLVGLTSSSSSPAQERVETPDSSFRYASTWNVSEDTSRLMGGASSSSCDQRLMLELYHNGSVEEDASIDILEDYDELRSGRFSCLLETLRSKLLTSLPCVTEDLLSRAIINEFVSNDDDDEDYEGESSSAPGKREGDNTEADHLLDLIRHHWQGTSRRRGSSSSSSSHKKQHQPQRGTAQDYFEQCLCQILHQIRTEELQSAEQAYTIVLTLAAGLGLHDNEASLRNVVLLQLPETVSRASLYDECSVFGKVMALGVSRKQPLFAFCRFDDEQSVARILSNPNAEALLIRGRIRPKLQGLGKLRRLCNKSQQRRPSPPEQQTTSQDGSCGGGGGDDYQNQSTNWTIDPAAFEVGDDILDGLGHTVASPTCVSKCMSKSTIFR